VASGVYPGSFNPPTVAHLAIAEAAVQQCRLDRVDLVISVDALGKDDADLLPIEQRVSMLEAAGARRPWLGVRTTHQRLIADIAEGYDLIVVGADKWAQVLDPAWYGGSVAERDRAVARLPRVAVAPRAGHRVAVHPACTPVILDVHEDHHHVSASAVRAGERRWLLPEAAEPLDDGR
jgi:hypothetical protein